MTDIGELALRIRADASELQRELAKASGSVKEHAGIMQQALETLQDQFKEFLPAITLASVYEFTKGALEAADNIYIMAQRIGFAGDTLSALNIPLQQNGSSIDEFASSMKFMSRNIELAAEGNQELIQRFDSLGLSVTKLKQLTPEEQFKEIASALGQVTDQGQLTADTLNLMGRGAAGLIPILKETKGNIQEVIDAQNEQGNVLSPEQLEKIHEAEDRWISFWGHIKVGAAEATLSVMEFVKAAQEANDADKMNLFGTGPREGLRGTVSDKNPGTIVTDKTDPYGPFSLDQQAAKAKSAKGSNDDLLTGEKEAAEQLQPYIDKLGEEAKAAEVSARALYVKRTEMEADTKAQNDYTNGLRDTQTLTDEEKTQVDAAAGALYDHKEALAQNKQIADQLAGSLTRIVTNFKDMKSAITDLFQSIAAEIVKSQIAKPFSDSLQGLFAGSSTGGGGLFSGFSSMLGFADGGNPPVGVPSIVGENGPELFVPSQSGTVISNGKLGGSNVSVYQTFNMQPGLAETVGVAIQAAAPHIAAAAQMSVMNAIQSGGDASRIVGRRS